MGIFSDALTRIKRPYKTIITIELYGKKWRGTVYTRSYNRQRAKQDAIAQAKEKMTITADKPVRHK